MQGGGHSLFTPKHPETQLWGLRILDPLHAEAKSNHIIACLELLFHFLSTAQMPTQRTSWKDSTVYSQN